MSLAGEEALLEQLTSAKPILLTKVYIHNILNVLDYLSKPRIIANNTFEHSSYKTYIINLNNFQVPRNIALNYAL